MNGKILIVHGSRMARSIVSRLMLAEAPEFALLEAECCQQAKKQLCDHAVDVVLCDEVLSDAAGAQLIESLRQSGSGGSAEFIVILSESTAAENRLALQAAGINRFLQVPFDGEKIAAAVRATAKPRKRRVHRRVSIPGARTRFAFDETEVTGSILNFSVNGMLVEFAYERELGDIFRIATLDLEFPKELSLETISNLRGRIIRSQVLSHRPDLLPERIHAAWQFLDVSQVELANLQNIISRVDAEEDLTAVESQAFAR